MKKLISIISIAVFLAVSILPFCASAAEKDVPVIIVPGYSHPTLVNQDTGEKVWGLDWDAVGEKVREKLPNLAGAAGGVFTGNTDDLADIIGQTVLEVMEPLACNPDGSSKYNVTYYPYGAENMQASVLIERGQLEDLYGEKELYAELVKDRGPENIFFFTHDWRMGQIEYADAIDQYIQEVKEITGCEKVDIFGLSHGGQSVSSYLYYHGTNGDVRKALVDAPAIGGTSMVGDPLTGQPVNLDYSTILQFVQIGQHSEDEFEWLIKYIGYDNLNTVVTKIAEKYIVDYIKTFNSIWDFVPLDDFEAALEYTGLNEEENGDLYRNTVRYHEEAMTHMSEGLKAAQNAGVNIAIISNYGFENVTGSNKNSDYIINTHTSSGAYCAPFDEKFPADYEKINSTCTSPDSGDNPTDHYHISPERNIDASCAYLPENTWFVNGQFHGQYARDKYTFPFILEFFRTDKITDVYSDARYPQFMRAQNPADGIYAEFDNTASGFHTDNDTRLLVKNLSDEFDIQILYITVQNSDMKISYNNFESLPYNNSLSLSFTEDELPSSDQPFAITIFYLLRNNRNLVQSRTFEFTALSEEEALQYSSIARPTTEFENIIEMESNVESGNEDPADVNTEDLQDDETVTGTDAEPISTDMAAELISTDTSASNLTYVQASDNTAPNTNTGFNYWFVGVVDAICCVGIALLVIVKRKIKE